MPILDQDQLATNVEPTQPLMGDTDTNYKDKEQAPSFSDQLISPWKTQNSIGSLIHNGYQSYNISDEARNHNSWPNIKDTQYQNQYGRFLGSESDAQDAQIKGQIDDEAKQRNIQAHSGPLGMASSMLSGITDPTAWLGIAAMAAVPGVGELAGLGMAGRAIASSAAFMAGTATQEAALHVSQPARTLEESEKNVESAGLFGGILGAAGAKGVAAGAAAGATLMGGNDAFYNPNHSLATVAVNAAMGGIMGGAMGRIPPVREQLGKDMLQNTVVNGTPGKIEITPEGAQVNIPGSPELGNHLTESERQSIGAGSLAEAPPVRPGLYQMNDTVAKITSVPGLSNPLIEGVTSKSDLLRKWTPEIFETDLIQNQNVVKNGAGGEAPPPSIQTKLDYGKKVAHDFQDMADNAYLKYTKTEPGIAQTVRAYKNASDTGLLNRADFDTEVQKAMLNEDQHSIPEVAEVARKSREIIKALNDEMTKPEIGIMDKEELDKLTKQYGETYLMHVYDLPKILGDQLGFINTAKKGYMEQNGVGDFEAEEMANKAKDSIIGLGEDQVALSDVSRLSLDKGVKFTKERTIGLPTSTLLDYMSHRHTENMQMYIRQAQRMISYKEFLNNQGAESTNDLKTMLQEEYTGKQNDAKDMMDNGQLSEEDFNKQSKQLSKDATNHINLLSDFSEIALGQYAHRTSADKALSMLRTYNYTRLMGNFSITAIPHLGAGIIRQGFGDVLSHGFGQAATDFATGIRGAVRQDLHDMGIATDHAVNDVLRGLLDPSEKGFAGRTGQAMGLIDNAYSKIAMIDPFIKTSQTIYGTVAQAHLIRNIKNYATLSDEEKTYLNSMHIGSDHIPALQEQIDNHSINTNGSWLSNTKEWDTTTPELQEAKDRFIMANQIESRSAIPKAGMGDTPRVVQKYAVAKNFFQFHGFFAAAANKILLSGMQQRSMKTVAGFSALITLGYMSYAIKQELAGKPVDTSIGGAMTEGLTRSGMFGLMTDPIFGMIVKPALGLGGSKYFRANSFEYALGPSFSAVKDAYGIGSDVVNGSVNKETKRKMESFIPFQNVWYLRKLFSLLNGGSK